MPINTIRSPTRRCPLSGCARLLGLLAASLLTMPVALAFSVEPMLMELSPFGGSSRVSMSITNEGSTPLTIEARSLRMAHDADGNEALSDAEDSLLVFPPVAIVQPGSAQTLQVQYTGDPELANSETYRIVIENVPVSLDGTGTSGVSIQTSVQTLLHVVPAGARGTIRSLGITEAPNGNWYVSIANEGDRYARLVDTRWTLESGSAGTRTLEGEEVDRLVGPNLVLPGSSRRFEFQAPDGFRAADTSIRIDPIE